MVAEPSEQNVVQLYCVRQHRRAISKCSVNTYQHQRRRLIDAAARINKHSPSSPTQSHRLINCAALAPNSTETRFFTALTK